MAEIITAQSIVVVTRQQRSADLESGEKIILNLKDGVYYSLNEVARRIWELFQEPRQVYQVIETLTSEYDIDSDRCTKELYELLADLANRGLIEITNEAAA